MTRSWISDTSDEIEHPPVPLGLNEMAVPRVALILSIITLLMVILSSAWVGISAKYFIDNLDPFESNNSQILNSDGRWLWELDLLFDKVSLIIFENFLSLSSQKLEVKLSVFSKVLQLLQI